MDYSEWMNLPPRASVTFVIKKNNIDLPFCILFTAPVFTHPRCTKDLTHVGTRGPVSTSLSH